jgi:hypothetical protein
LALGTYEYCLVVDGQWMPDPLARETVPNRFGGRNPVLTVASTPEAAQPPPPPMITRRSMIQPCSGGPLGIHKQQHDPTDERQHSDDWRDKVLYCGLKVHPKEVDRLSWSCEGDA